MPDICFWNKCNNYCLFCSNPDGRWREENYDYDHLTARLAKLAADTADITITGGEPTIHPDFLKIMAFLKRKLPRAKLHLLTNGRRFCYPSFASVCLGCDNITDIMISLHGYNIRTHDRITQVRGSFEQTIKGIKNILKYKSRRQNLELRVVISGLTASYIDKILHFIRVNLPEVHKVVLMFMEVEGKAKDGLKTTGITFQEWAKYWPRVEPVMQDFREMGLYHFPLCALKPGLWKYMWRTLPESEIAFPPRCKSCWCRSHCLGVHKGYLKCIGSSEFLPPPRLIIKTSDNSSHPIIDARS